MKQYCLALDLKDDPELIAQYDRHHQQVWPGVRESILGSGIRKLQIFRVQNRLFMILETDDDFSFEEKAKADHLNPTVREWEQLMWKYQEAMPWALPGEKWQLMQKICEIP